MKRKFINLYMDFAKRVAQLSYARKLQVGAVIVKNDTVISYGYNGTPAGWDNNCEDKLYLSPWNGEHDDAENVTYTLKTKPEVIHAESNAISKLAKSHNSGLDADLFITHSPCIECAKLIYQSGIRRVFYSENYRDDAGTKFLEKSGIEIIKHDKTCI